MTSSIAPKAFISYTHDSLEHEDAVIALADRLRSDGIDAQLDQYESAPPEGWTRWMRNAIETADFVLVICTEHYQRRAEGKEQHGKGLGGNREGLIVDQTIYESDGRNEKFIAVTVRSADRRFIPDFLRPYQSESIETETAYERLYRRLTNQPDVVKPELGRLRSLPRRQRRSSPIESGGITGQRPARQEESHSNTVQNFVGPQLQKWSWVLLGTAIALAGTLVLRLNRHSREPSIPSQHETGSPTQNGEAGRPPSDQTDESRRPQAPDQKYQEETPHPKLRVLHPDRMPKTNLALNANDRVLSLRGGTASVGPNGQIRSVKGNGIRIDHNLHGGRTIVSEHGETLIVTAGGRGGYVQHPYVKHDGQTYYSRTYYRNGIYRSALYRGYTYEGRTYYSYTPSSYFNQAFYAWAQSPWPEPVLYQWGWSGAPWYGYYGPYFSPYPMYSTAAFWLTDYLVAANLEPAYAAHVVSGADHGDSQADADQSNPRSRTGLGPEVKATIADEITEQISARRAASVQNAGPGAPAEPNRDDVPPALHPRWRTFVVSTDITVLAEGSECSLTAGDVINRLTDSPNQDQKVNATVLSSKRTDCPSGKQIAISVDDLQEMYNRFQENVDEGLKELADKEGKRGLPHAPQINVLPGDLPAPRVDTNAAQLLREQQEAADRLEMEVKQEVIRTQEHRDK